MTKWKYKTDGIGKNKKIREQRKKPLPLELMRHDEFNGIRIDDGRSREDTDDLPIIPGAEGHRNW